MHEVLLCRVSNDGFVDVLVAYEMINIIIMVGEHGQSIPFIS